MGNGAGFLYTVIWEKRHLSRLLGGVICGHLYNVTFHVLDLYSDLISPVGMNVLFIFLLVDGTLLYELHSIK